MESNRDFRKSDDSTVNGFKIRCHKITSQSDLTDEYGRMALQETVKFRFRERLHKDRNREFTKRRRGGPGDGCYRKNERTDSSDEEYHEEEDDARVYNHNRLDYLSLKSSSTFSNRRGFLDFTPSTQLRAGGYKMLGFSVPQKARSGTVKRLQDCRSSGDKGFREEFSATTCSAAWREASPSSFCGSSNKKMKVLEAKTRSSTSDSRSSSTTQADIEIEVAEALFDLMKQSHSQLHILPDREKRDDRTSKSDSHDERKKLIADGKDEAPPEMNAGETLVDPMRDVKKKASTEKEKFQDGFPVVELLNGGDELVKKRQVGSPKDSESLSCVKDACDTHTQDTTTATNANHAANGNKETKLEIDLMASPRLPSIPERDVSVGGREVFKKNGEATTKRGPSTVLSTMKERSELLICNALPNLYLDKQKEIAASQLLGQKNMKDQSSSLPVVSRGMANWHGGPPSTGYMPQLHASPANSPMMMKNENVQPQKFKLSQPQSKRCSLHHDIASNIKHHQKLISKSLSSAPTGLATIHGSKLNLNAMLASQNLVPGDPLMGGGKNSANNRALLQLASQQQAASANGLLCGPGYLHPTGQKQSSRKLISNSSAAPQSASAASNSSLPANSAGKPPFPGGRRAALSFNHPVYPPTEATPFMGLLQNNGSCSTVPSSPFDLSFYTPVFSVAQNQQLQHLSQKSSQNQQQLETLSSSGVGNARKSSNTVSLASPPANLYNARAINDAMIPRLPTVDGAAGKQMVQTMTFPNFPQHPNPLVQLQKHHIEVYRAAKCNKAASTRTNIAESPVGNWETTSPTITLNQQHVKNSLNQHTRYIFRE